MNTITQQPSLSVISLTEVNHGRWRIVNLLQQATCGTIKCWWIWFVCGWMRAQRLWPVKGDTPVKFTVNLLRVTMSFMQPLLCYVPQCSERYPWRGRGPNKQQSVWMFTFSFMGPLLFDCTSWFIMTDTDTALIKHVCSHFSFFMKYVQLIQGTLAGHSFQT